MAVGVWTLMEKSDYISLLNSSFYSASAYILIAAGLIVIVTGIIGCCATLKEMKSILIVVRWIRHTKHCPLAEKCLFHSTKAIKPLLIMWNQKARKDTSSSSSCLYTQPGLSLHVLKVNP